VPELAALVLRRLGDHHDEVADLALRVRGVIPDRDAEDRERGVTAPIWREREPADLGRREARGRRLLRAVQELLAVHDLQQAVAAGAVREVHAVAGGDRAVRALRDRYRSRRGGLLADQAEVTDEHRLRGIAQVVDLRHASRAP